MKIQNLEEILVDQKEMEVDTFDPSKYCTRPEEQYIVPAHEWLCS